MAVWGRIVYKPHQPWKTHFACMIPPAKFKNMFLHDAHTCALNLSLYIPRTTYQMNDGLTSNTKRLAPWREQMWVPATGSWQGLRNWLNWVHKIGNYKVIGHPLLQERPQYTQSSTINMYLLIEIGHNILIECHGYYLKVKTIICLKMKFLSCFS